MTKRVIACLAALTLALSLLPVTALADVEVQTPNTTVEVSGGESGASQSEGTTTGGTEETGSTEGEGTGSGDESQETAYVAQIGEDKYATLDAAITAAWGSAEPVTITLLANCEITIGTIDKPVTINGNGHTVDIPPQEVNNTSDLQHRLSVNSALTFNNTVISFHNDQISNNTWSAVFNSKGSLTLDGKSVCTVTDSGFYAYAGAVINVWGESRLTFSDTHYTALMSDGKYASLNVTGDSIFEIKNTKAQNGLTQFDIKVNDSKFFVDNCENQGLVGCQLTLDGSKADISGNTYGITGRNNTDVLTMKNGSVLTMDDNSEAGIFLWGGTVEVQSGNTLSITNTGKRFVVSDETDYRGIGAFVCEYYRPSYYGDVTFADGATVEIVNNPLGGINSDCKMNLGKGTVIMYNGGTLIPYGGGINTRGEITMAEGVRLYNNHAATAGDDIYVASDTTVDGKKELTGTITFGSVGSNWTLNSDPDCGHRIDGWYLDGQEKTETKNDANKVVTTPIRWNGKTTKDGLCLEGRDEYYKLFSDTGKPIEATLALKAAHGYLNNNPPVIRDNYYTVTVNYVDEAGNTVAPSYTTGSLKEGTAYDVTAQDAIAIPGYTYKTTTGDPTTGTLNGNKVVTVVYTKTADIDDGNTPTDPGDPGSDIDDPNTPTSPAEPPKTGDMMPLFAALTTLSAAAIVLLSKKREEA